MFDDIKIELDNVVCHSGGASGSDTFFHEIGLEYGVTTKAYSYETVYHTSDSKVEISIDDYKEGIVEVNKANRVLGRYGISKYMNLLARNWTQVKYSDETFAIGQIIRPGQKGNRGFYNKSKMSVVDGGTSYAVQMSINHNRKVYVFDQNRDKWYRWSYISIDFIECDVPKITSNNFAGIGTREIKENGVNAIKNLYKNTFSK